MFAEMLDDKEASGDLCNVATLEASHGFPTYPPPAPDDRPPPPEPAASPGPPRRCSPLPETIGVSRWKLGKLIGSGSYAASCIRDDVREILTGKTMRHRYRRARRATPLKKHLEETHREIAILSTLKHDNIVKYLGSEIDEPEAKIHIFQEWVPGGTLAANVKAFGGTFDDAITRRYLRHVLNGLVFLHAQRVVHRDIKGENVLISDTGVAKLADFGASKRLGEEGTLMQTGSLRGHALLHGAGTDDGQGRRPQTKNFKTPYALMIAVCRSSDGPPVDGYDLSPELLDFIGRCFTRDAERRPSADDILRHAFLASLGDSASAPSLAAPAPLPPTPGKKPDFLQRLKARLSSP
ncbi:MAP kinase kinase kinase [Aureococcus anophagefferens]|nr:MAP kinase kinase kinase [Aureococcus anophagefferens]